MMIQRVRELEAAARITMADYSVSDPLPPRLDRRHLGYLGLGALALAALVAVLFLF